MNIVIEYINELAVQQLINECSIRIFKSCVHMEEGLYTCVLNENAIIKTLVDEVLIDLGGNKCFINKSDFFTITIE